MKISNLVVEETAESEKFKWADVLSYRARLLYQSDWIVQIGSGIHKTYKWFKWRDQVRDCKRDNFSTPDEMWKYLETLEDSAPVIRRISKIRSFSLDEVKEYTIKLVRYYYSKKLEVELYSYLNSPALIIERYNEAEIYKKTRDLSTCYFMQSYIQSTGKNVKDTLEYFSKQKETYFLMLFRSQKEMENAISEAEKINDIEKLSKLQDEYNIWISTLTSTPVQI